MKKVIGSLMALFFVVGITFVCFAAELGPVVSMGTPLVKMAGKKTAGVVIMGTGFKPGQEVRILFVTPDGLQSDIGYALKPAPKSDMAGSWATTWNAGRYVARKLVNPKGGAYKIVVSDSEYNPIVHTAVFFQAPKKKKKKK
jgi:hypothetical protein